MKQHPHPTPSTPEIANDLALPGGCPLCGGDLSLRLGEGGDAGSCCRSCRWISRPQVRAANGTVTVIHPAGGVA